MSKDLEMVIQSIEAQVEIVGSSRLKSKCYATLLKCYEALVDLEMEL